MPSDTKKSVDALNKALASEWTAYHQYILHARELESMGYKALRKDLHAVSKAEREHAQELMDRILFLGGTPKTLPDAPVEHGTSVGVLLSSDVSLEETAIALYNRLIDDLSGNGDSVTRDLFRHILAEETDHLDSFQKLRTHCSKLGPAWLAEQT